MREELEAKLVTRFQFLKRGADDTPYNRFGIECDDGWYTILVELFTKLHALQIHNFQIDQVKEKFGGLRVYYSCQTSKKIRREINALIVTAEKKSLSVCEYCGASGEPVKIRKFLSKTLCRKCQARA